MEIDKLLDDIAENAIKGRDELGWNKNEIIRYVYIRLGQHISKNVNFFYSAYNKFRQNDKLSEEEMKQIQESDASYDTTCKTTAKMLIYILKKVGIEAQLIQTSDSDEYRQTPDSPNKFDIYHFFVCCTGEDNKKYFLTLNADLTNIKMGFPTIHFANNIRYYKTDPKTGEYELDENGNKKTYYQGEEIKHSTLSLLELEKIDRKIGYLMHIGDEYKYVPTLKTITGKNAEEKYINALIELDEFNFYKGLLNTFSKFAKQGYSELTKEELFEIHKYIYLKSINLLKEKFNITIDNTLINNSIILLEQKEYLKIKEQLQTIIKTNIKSDSINGKELYENPLALINSTISLIQSINKLSEEPTKKNHNTYKKYLNNLLKFYIDQSKLRKSQIENQEERYSNLYVFQKIKIMFSKDFDCTTSKKKGSITNYNKMGLLEQQIFLRDYLKKIMGLELSEEEFQEKIIIASARSKEDKDNYHFLILISNKFDDHEHIYLLDYDPKRNILLEDVSLFDIYSKYTILSDTMNNRLEEIEKNRKKR